jgi:anti-sigma B factor antagonist
MKIQTRQAQQSAEILAIEGELDFHAAAEVRDAISKLTDKQAPKILIDFSGVSYIDSSGLAIFVEAFQKIKRYGGKLVLFSLAPSVLNVFEVARLNSLFRLASTETEALSL